MTDQKLARNMTSLAHLEITGAGQVYVEGNYAYLGHLQNKERHGTSILDVSDPRKPRVVSQILLEDDRSHSHKARVVGDIMIVNSEMNGSALGRKSELIAPARATLQQQLGRAPTHKEIADVLALKEEDIPALEEAERNPYDQGGFKIYDIKDKTKPRLLAFKKTGGRGVHRFDMDGNYAYISTELPGYVGAMLVIYDIRDPENPAEVSKWWLPGQHVAGGEKASWSGRSHRLHHALRVGNLLWAGCWMAGGRVIDVTDIRNPKTVGAHNYHPPFLEPTHSFRQMPEPINGKRIAVAIDEEDHVHGADEMRHRGGRPHAGLWVYDATDLGNLHQISTFHLSEMESPWSRATPGRFGSHQFFERMKSGTLVYCTWFSGGLRVIDLANPNIPTEVAYYIPQPAPGRAGPMTNDVDVDSRGIVYVSDRGPQFDILELKL